MAYNDLFRISCHAIITDASGKVLMCKANYGKQTWGLPGGGVDPGETIHDCVKRECMEELGCEISILYLSGVYFHHSHHSFTCIFRCELPIDSEVTLSEEHSQRAYRSLEEMTFAQSERVKDCLTYDGTVKSRVFE